MRKDIFDKLKEISNMNEFNNEMVRFATNSVDFMETHATILHPSRGVIPFEMYPHQKDLLRSYSENRFNIVLSARQMGITYTNAAHALHQAFFNADNNILIAGNSLREADEVLSKIRIMYESLPVRYKEINRLILNHKHQLSFANGTDIVAVPATADAIRGYTPNLVIADNITYASNRIQEEFICLIQAALPPNGKVIFTSTGVVAGTPFNRLWENATKGFRPFVPHRVRWDATPDRGEDFKRNTMEKYGEARWKAEYECSFND